MNNQLLCYDPTTQKWINPQCLGAVPCPRSSHGSAISKNKVWVFGGKDKDYHYLDNFFELNMYTYMWSQIDTAQLSPQARAASTLTATEDNHLVLQGGYAQALASGMNNIWIIDLTTYSWRPYTSRRDHGHMGHTASCGFNSNIIVLGGFCGDTSEAYNKVFHVMLGPKSLQKLAMYTIYNHQDELAWKCLPKKLLTLTDISDKEQASSDVLPESEFATNH